MIRNLTSVVALALLSACASGPGADANTPDATAEAKTDAAPSGEDISCTDEQNCREQGSLARMVGQMEKAKAYFRKGCDMEAASQSCEALEATSAP